MDTVVPVTVIRHPKERRSKCSLTPLEGRPDIRFLNARENWEFDVAGYTVLALGAPQLSAEDAERHCFCWIALGDYCPNWRPV